MTTKEYRQLKAYCRYYGLYAGLIWIAGFYSCVCNFPPGLSSLIVLACIAGTPVMIYYMTRYYRDGVCQGFISFRRGLFYSYLLCFYATLLTAIGVWVFFQFIDNGSFINQLMEPLKDEAVRQQLQASNVNLKDLDSEIAMMASMRPIDITFMFLAESLLFSFFMSAMVALLVKRTDYRQIQ